jgi:hypothetical protein
MMFFDDYKYPRCAGYLRTSIIGMNSESKVYKALVTCIEDEKLVRQAVSPGTYPRVIIQELLKGMYVIDGAYQGECAPETKNYVYVNTRIADGYENNPEQSPLSFGRTVLHEIVHWGRFIGGKSRDFGDKEAGNWFEHLTYGTAYQYHASAQCS